MRPLIVLLALVLLGAAGCRSGSEREAHVVTGDRAGRDAASLAVLDGADSITVRMEDLGPDLYRVSTPDDSPLRPRVSDDDERIRVHLRERDGAGAAALDVVLHSGVQWSVAVNAGASDMLLDVAGGRIDGIDVTGGADRIEIRLPEPRGTLPVRMTDGASQFAISHPAGVPSRVLVAAGAGSVRVDGQTHSGVAAGTVFASPGWEQAEHRYEIESAGVSSLVVEAA